MVAKIVVVKGCSRRVRCASLGATVTIVPMAFSLAYRLATVLSIANFNMHCGMDGWGRRYDYVAAIASLDADIVVLEEAWTADGDGGGRAGGTWRRAISATRWWRTLIGEGRRIQPQPDADDRWIAQPSMRDRNRALYMDGVRPVHRGRPVPDPLAGGRARQHGDRRPGAARISRLRPVAYCSCASCGPTACDAPPSWST